MSHFTMTVAIDHTVPADRLREELERILAPYDENIEVPRYVEYTRGQLIAKGRARIESFRDTTYAEFLVDPVAYEERYGERNPAHIQYVKEEFPERLTWTDDQIYADESRGYSDEERGPEGEVYSTYNPKSKWDWWAIGGRWGGRFKLKEGVVRAQLPLDTEPHAFGMADGADNPGRTDCARVESLDLQEDSAWGFIDEEGEWHEKGAMGWWGLNDADESEAGEARWRADYREWLAGLHPETWLVNIDCHI